MKAENIIRPGPSNKHMFHREELIHSEASRAFLTDPAWPRTDHSPNLSNFSDRKIKPVTRVKKMQNALITAQNKHQQTSEKLAIVNDY